MQVFSGTGNTVNFDDEAKPETHSQCSIKGISARPQKPPYARSPVRADGQPESAFLPEVGPSPGQYAD